MEYNIYVTESTSSNHIGMYALIAAGKAIGANDYIDNINRLDSHDYCFRPVDEDDVINDIYSHVSELIVFIGE